MNFWSKFKKTKKTPTYYCIIIDLFTRVYIKDVLMYKSTLFTRPVIINLQALVHYEM